MGTARVQAIAEEAAAIGAGAVIVPGGGFTDSGGAATDLAASLATLSDVTGISVVGPTAWASSTSSPARCPTSAPFPTQVRRGGVAAIAQSGAVIEAFVNCGGRVPFSTLVSSGAEAVTTTGDYLRFFANDPETNAVLVFIEGFVDAPDVLAAAREMAEAGKTVAACFVGRSAKARDGILAHSGKLAPSARVTAAALQQAGVVLADDLDELITIGEILGTGRRESGTRTHIVTNSGGEANMLSDLAEDAASSYPNSPALHRLHSPSGGPPFTARTHWIHGVSTTTPRSTQSPSTPSPAKRGDIIIVSQDQQVTCRRLRAAAGPRSRPVPRRRDARPRRCSGPAQPDQPRPRSSPHGVLPPATTSPCCAAPAALRALGALAHRTPRAPVVERTPARIAAVTETVELTEDVALAILGECSVPTPRQERVTDAGRSRRSRCQFRWPVVIKAVAEGLLHKSDFGLVVTNVVGTDAVQLAAREVLCAASTAGLEVELLVVEQIRVRWTSSSATSATRSSARRRSWASAASGLRCSTPSAFTSAPSTSTPPNSLLASSQVGRMIAAARGGALDVDGVARALVAVTDLGIAHPEVVAIDVNPLIVGRDRPSPSTP